MKRLMILLLLCCVCAPAYSQQSKFERERDRANQKAEQLKKHAENAAAFEAQLRAEVKERADLYDIQYEADEGFNFSSFEISTTKGSYRLEERFRKLLIEGVAVIEVKGCYVSITDLGKFVSTINLCRGTAAAYSFEQKRPFNFYDGDEDDGDYCDGEDCGEDADGPPPGSEWCR